MLSCFSLPPKSATMYPVPGVLSMSDILSLQYNEAASGSRAKVNESSGIPA